MTDLVVRFERLRLSDRARPVVTIVLAVVAAGLALGPGYAAATGSGQPIDYDVFGAPGAAVLTGRWVGVFSDPIIQAGPFELMLWGVPHLLGVHGVVAWGIVDAILSLLLTAAIVLTVHRAIHDLTVDAAPIALIAAILAIAMGIVTSSISDGHPSEIVVPLMWVAAALLARGGHPFWAAVVLGAPAGWELGGLLGAPVLLLAPTRPLRAIAWGVAGGALALLVLFAPFVLLGPFRMFEYHWTLRPGTLPALWLHDGGFPWQLRALQGGLALATSALAAVLLRRSRDAVWLVALVACSVRLLFDPVLAGYYFDPPTILVLTGLAIALARRALLEFLVSLVLLNLALDLHGLIVVGAAVLLVAVLATVVLALVRQRPRRDVAPST